MIAVLQPGRPAGRVTAPPSKSMAHRAVLAAGLARGLSRVRNLEYSQDVLATLNAVRQLGARVEIRENWADIEGRGGFATLRAPIDCGESGSTLRFLIPVCSLTGQQVRFCGRGRLMQRPQGPYAEIFEQQGRMFCQNETGILIKGGLRPGEYRLAGDVSSQFISGLLFALPLMMGDSSITITPPFESRSYVNLTLAALADFGVRARFVPDEELPQGAAARLEVPGNQRYHNREYTVEGDYSQGAFFAVLGALRGDITVEGLAPASGQGDAAILEILQRCGARFTRTGDAVQFAKSELTAVEIDLADCPDLGPILMVLGAFCKGKTVIRNAGRLRLKESDRIAAMEEELRRFGVQIRSTEDTVTIAGGPLVMPGELQGHNDHRVVMALTVAALAAQLPVRIHGAEAVAKSWPAFFDVVRGLGVPVAEEE